MAASGLRRHRDRVAPRAWLAVTLGIALLAGACSSSTADTDATAVTPAPTGTATPDTSTDPTADAPVEGAADPSPGCLEPVAAASPSEQVPLSSGGAQRWYLRHVPTATTDGEPMPLVLDLHGYASGAVVQAAISGLATVGEGAGFVTVTPQGSGSPVHWDARLDSPDLDFVGDLLDEVEQTTCIDRNRVYVAGFSNGAALTSAVACRYADRIAAVATVAGMRDVPGCDPARAVPVIAFHATDDRFVVYDGGLGSALAALPAPEGPHATLGDAPEAVAQILPGPIDHGIPDIAVAWAGRNGCEPHPTESAASSDTTLAAYRCPAGAEVELYRTEGAGHEWPGSQGSADLEPVAGPTTFTIDASELIWSFFSDHQR